MIDLRVHTFFDATELIRSVERAKRRALSRAGAFVRRRARSSIRKRRKPAPPGKPPSSHTGDLRRILFAYDPRAGSVVIGPMPFRAAEAPRLLEFGGRTVRQRRSGRRKVARYRARPFMGPALEKEVEAGTIAAQWHNAVNKT